MEPCDEARQPGPTAEDVPTALHHLAARPEARPAPPDIPRYEVRDFLGQGGLATGWLAFDRQARQDVALKVLPPPELIEGGEEGRLLNEAVAVARLDHPGIVRIHDLGLHAGRPYLSLELCRGGSLADRLGEAGR